MEEDVCVVGEKVSEKVGTFLYCAKLELTRPFPQRSTGAPQGQERWGAAVCGLGRLPARRKESAAVCNLPRDFHEVPEK